MGVGGELARTPSKTVNPLGPKRHINKNIISSRGGAARTAVPRIRIHLLRTPLTRYKYPAAGRLRR